jgi:plastocyanin
VRRASLIILSMLFTAGLLAACGSDDTSGSREPRPGGDMDDHMDDHMGGGRDEPSEVAEGAREIPVTASSFAFDPDEIRVRAGEDVAIVLSSTDIIHDFVVDEIDAHVAADGGETATGGLRAEEPGRYTFYCSVAGHREAGMDGTLVVEDH